MLISALAAVVMFAAPATTQAAAAADGKPAKSVEDKGPAKTCYTATPSGSRMPRKVCVTTAPKGEDKSEKSLKADAKAE